jgi:hypothetical protein
LEILRHLTAVGTFTIRSREVPPLETTRFSLTAVAVWGTSWELRKKNCAKRETVYTLENQMYKNTNWLRTRTKKKVGVGERDREPRG